MLKRIAMAVFIGLCAMASIAFAQIDKGYAPVNGLKLYYEIHGNGSGTPLVLLHGSFLTINLNYSQLIPELSKTRKVIAVETQGHGHTADIDRPYSFESLADDVAGLLQYLKFDSADVAGYSMGGEVAAQVAIRHPKLVRKLVLISCVFKYEGWSPETRAVFPNLTPEMFEGTPLKMEYDNVAPEPKHWSRLVSKIKQFVSTPYDFTAKMKSVQAPTLIILGDSDGVHPEHAVEMFRIRGGWVNGDLVGLPNSQLAVIPGTAHFTLMMRTELLLAMIEPFLKGESPR
ncbi:MAG: alpha/beta hydrolase [Nitrososphaera sp.]|nr:alpha/beta hydrolase [Nitrososphaera sp.]MCI0706420.1 alpha/beta hydrolase [Ignavibacteriota bacterium]